MTTATDPPVWPLWDVTCDRCQVVGKFRAPDEGQAMLLAFYNGWRFLTDDTGKLPDVDLCPECARKEGLA